MKKLVAYAADSHYTRSVSNPLHPSLDAGQTERYLLARLPIVILSTRTTHGRDRRPSPTRALPSAIPVPIADAVRRAPEGSRFLAFVGRLFPGADLVILENVRGADDLADRVISQPVIETTATEVR